MSELNPVLSTEFYSYEIPIRLQGAGAAAPTILKGGKGITITRTGAGAVTFTFAEDPGVYVGTDDGAYSAATVATAGSLALAEGVYTAATPSSQATLTLTFLAEAAGTYAAADLATTTTAYLKMVFLREGGDL